jgi:hypothetical protein
MSTPLIFMRSAFKRIALGYGRALAARRVVGNASSEALNALPMKTLLPFGLALALTASPISAQGAIGILERGTYTCELPGDASTEAGIAQPHEDFRIITASRYRTEQGRGIYLRRGDVVTFTSGPRKGETYSVISPAFLRRMENGQPGDLRCVRRNG